MPRQRRSSTWWLTLFVTMTSGSVWAQARDDSPSAIVGQDAPSRGASNVSEEVAQKAAAIARQTMSPFCPGRTLADCPSEYATAWRKDIRLMVAEGMSADEIQHELESRVGENLSGSPNRRASYAVPIGLALGSALLLFFVLSRLRQNSEDKTSRNRKNPTPPRDEPAKDEPTPVVDDRRLEQELALADGDDD